MKSHYHVRRPLLALLTWIHHRSAPHLLDTVPIPFPCFVSVDRAVARVVGVVLWLYLTIVDAVCELQVLQHLLHILLHGSQLGCPNSLQQELDRTSSVARTFAASMTAFVCGGPLGLLVRLPVEGCGCGGRPLVLPFGLDALLLPISIPDTGGGGPDGGGPGGGAYAGGAPLMSLLSVAIFDIPASISARFL